MTSETPPPAAVAPGRGAQLWWVAAAVALAVGHLTWVLAHFAPAIMSPDANGYVVQARLIATEGRTSFATESPVQFVGMHWLETREGVFHSRYPAGLPMMMAIAWKIGGLTAALLLNPLFASATVLLVFFLARPLAGNACALIAAAVVATIPVTNQHALDADAHIAATFFLVAGVIALRRFAAAKAVGWGIAAGVLLGIVPTIRYPEAIVGVAIAGWLAWRVRPLARAWPAVAGAAIPIGLLCAHNAIAYGAFWRTGYALTNEQTGFGLSYFFAHAIPYLQALGTQGPVLFFAFGTAGMIALASDPRWRGDGVLFVSIVAPLVLLYMAYYFGGGPGGAGGAGGGGLGGSGAAIGGNMRFLIPTFPFFAVGGAWLLSVLAKNLGPAGRVAVGVVAALQLLITGAGSQQTLERSKTTLTAAAHARTMAAKQIPAGSIVILDRSLAESLDAVGHWRIIEENFVGGMGPRGGGPGPGMGMRPMESGRRREADGSRPSPQQAGKNHAQQERYAGLSLSERRTRAWADLAAWAGDRPVYWFTRSLDTVESALPTGADYESLAEIDAPAMSFGGGPGMGPGGGPGMGMGPPGTTRGGRGGAGGAGGMRGGPFDPMQMGGPRGGMGFGPPGMGGFASEGANASNAKLRLVKITLRKI